MPWNEDSRALGERYGVDMYTGFNMTEISSPLISEPNPRELGVAGKPRRGVECRVVDGNDCEVAPGQVGELIVRTDRPWSMSHGYHKNPEATSESWRDGWFHTGDGFKYDEQGNFYLVDRMKDAIRGRHSSTLLPTPVSGNAVRSTASISMEARPISLVGRPSTASGAPVRAVCG